MSDYGNAKNPFSIEMAQRRAAHYANGRPVLDASLVMDELFRDLGTLRQMMELLRVEIAALRDEMRSKPQVVMFPTNALKHSR